MRHEILLALLGASEISVAFGNTRELFPRTLTRTATGHAVRLREARNPRAKISQLPEFNSNITGRVFPETDRVAVSTRCVSTDISCSTLNKRSEFRTEALGVNEASRLVVLNYDISDSLYAYAPESELE